MPRLDFPLAVVPISALPVLGILEQPEGNEILHEPTAVTAESALAQRCSINN